MKKVAQTLWLVAWASLFGALFAYCARLVLKDYERAKWEPQQRFEDERTAYRVYLMEHPTIKITFDEYVALLRVGQTNVK